jgi:hypothetical protein
VKAPSSFVTSPAGGLEGLFQTPTAETQPGRKAEFFMRQICRRYASLVSGSNEIVLSASNF